MLDLLFVAVFSCHLLAVQVAAGCPFVCLWLARQSTRGDDAAGEAARRLATLSLAALGVGALLGFASLGLLTLLRPTYLPMLLAVPGRGMWLGMSERLWSALAELVVFAISLWAWRGLWGWLDRRRFWQRFWHAAIGWFAALNVAYHLPPLFAVAAVLHERPELAADMPPFRVLMVDPEVLARSAHSLLAALVTAGVALMALAPRMPAAQDRLALWGARWALVPGVLQLIVGPWLTFVLPETSRRALLGADMLAAGLFMAALGISFWLLHVLSDCAQGENSPATTRRCVALLVLVVVLMVGVRQRARHFVPEAAPVATTTTPHGEGRGLEVRRERRSTSVQGAVPIPQTSRTGQHRRLPGPMVRKCGVSHRAG